jgi:hypothetical protein
MMDYLFRLSDVERESFFKPLSNVRHGYDKRCYRRITASIPYHIYHDYQMVHICVINSVYLGLCDDMIKVDV